MNRRIRIRLAIILPILALIGWASWYGVNVLCAGNLDIVTMAEIGDFDGVSYVIRYRPGRADQIAARRRIGWDPGHDRPGLYDCDTTPLHAAAEQGHADIARLLLRAGANTNTTDSVQQSPLHWAAGLGNTDMAKLLLSNGAEVDLPGYDDKTPLHYAAINGYSKTVQLLIGAGAEVNAEDINGATPLDVAGEVMVSECLRKHGAKTGAKLSTEGGRK